MRPWPPRSLLQEAVDVATADIERHPGAPDQADQPLLMRLLCRQTLTRWPPETAAERPMRPMRRHHRRRRPCWPRTGGANPRHSSLLAGRHRRPRSPLSQAAGRQIMAPAKTADAASSYLWSEHAADRAAYLRSNAVATWTRCLLTTLARRLGRHRPPPPGLRRTTSATSAPRYSSRRQRRHRPLLPRRPRRRRPA